MRRVLWFTTALGSFLGALLFVFGVPSAESAVQEGSVAAMAIGLAVIPYCLARAANELKALKDADDAEGKTSGEPEQEPSSDSKQT